MGKVRACLQNEDNFGLKKKIGLKMAIFCARMKPLAVIRLQAQYAEICGYIVNVNRDQ